MWTTTAPVRRALRPLKTMQRSPLVMTAKCLCKAAPGKRPRHPGQMKNRIRAKKKERMQTDERPVAVHCSDSDPGSDPGPGSDRDPDRDLAAWLALLEKRSSEAHIDLGLARVRQVWKGMETVLSAPVITVAGTNGKGSTVAMLEAMLTAAGHRPLRSEEHTSELQSRGQLVCRLLLEKKNTRRT